MTVRWEEITGKPSVFPPAVHTHHPDALEGDRTSDYGARGAGAGYQMGLVRLDASAVAIVVPAIALATPFYTVQVGKFLHLRVVGEDVTGPNVFMDEIWVCGAGTPFTIGAISQNNMIGAPGARTYTLNLSNIEMAIAGTPPVVNYNVRFKVEEY